MQKKKKSRKIMPLSQTQQKKTQKYIILSLQKKVFVLSAFERHISCVPLNNLPGFA